MRGGGGESDETDVTGGEQRRREEKAPFPPFYLNLSAFSLPSNDA